LNTPGAGAEAEAGAKPALTLVGHVPDAAQAAAQVAEPAVKQTAEKTTAQLTGPEELHQLRAG